ncbi:hypothetical protein [Gordonia rubripertincta]|uniref:hypothetical protein n=1 Tax=Gordonia rubripertincta TaxID=36822 RepID=UPI0015FB9625|nr:hypothetical protein [Gordonia rubripertincta]QMU22494.1 hypothetical protein H3V45_08515 [Gordonia rubripertincta]
MTDQPERARGELPELPSPPAAPRLPAMWLINLVAIVILLIWVVSFVVRIAWPERAAFPPSIDAAMLMVAGFLFAGNLKDRFTGGGGDKK